MARSDLRALRIRDAGVGLAGRVLGREGVTELVVDFDFEIDGVE